ncbi:MAG: BlaI/MecI/CopY family transcriptional regulator [Parachlamydiaceae bacterium]|nr:BlaI/MecI/CopY family transcriptional regulator [Parachlamydiaceae bacterium]
MSKRAFGELESQIMCILKSGQRKTVKDVHQALGGDDNYNTIMTVMSRLAEKRILARDKVGLQYVYWTLQDMTTDSILSKIKHKFFGIKTTALVSHLIETAEDLTDEDLAEMEQMVHKMRELKNGH